MDASTRRYLRALLRAGGLQTFSQAARNTVARSHALSTAQAAGWIDRTSAGYAVNSAGRNALDRGGAQ